MCDDLMQDSVQGTEEIFLANAILGECPIPGVFMCSKVVEEFEDYFKGLFAPDSSSEDMDERDIGPVNHNDDTSSTSSSDDINNIDGGGGSPDLPPPPILTHLLTTTHPPSTTSTLTSLRSRTQKKRRTSTTS